MITMTAADIAKIVGGSLRNLSGEELISQYPVIDSRQVKNDTFFVAFEGEHFDGHDFAEAAILAGARFALVSKEVNVPSIVVADPINALAELAKHARNCLPNLKVIGITGSQGKTTTKDLLSHLLEIVAPTVAPSGNLNNEIGVPLTLLRCDENTKFCVVEMGARHLGDIAHLVEIAAPDVGVVLVVGQAHIGEFGSREIIAKTKAELIQGLSSEAIAVLGTYDEFTPHMSDGSSRKVLRFGEKSNCEIRAADIELREGRAHFDLVTPEGRQPVSLQLLGLHQISNALAAAAVATALHIPLETIAAALSTAEPGSKWRMELHDVNGLLLINDAYNANPESMAAALRTLALMSQERGGRSWAFLGKMGELGASETSSHSAIGRLVSDIGIDHLVTVGTDLFDLETTSNSSLDDQGDATTVHACAEISDATPFVEHFEAGDVVLVKASRSEQLNELAQELLNLWKAAHE